MNDRFKFRAWVQDEKQMLNDISTWTDDYTDMLNETIAYHQDHGIVLMQSTGLKDKNGKLIYEGDIIEFEEPNFESAILKCAVVMDRGCYCAHWDRLEDMGREDFIPLYEIDELEIIGNQYENPDLLT